MKIILLLTGAFILGIYYWQVHSEAKYRDNKLFLVTIPKYAYESEEIQILLKEFKVAVNKLFLFLSILFIPNFILPSWMAIIFFFIWTFGSFAVGFYPLKLFNKRLKQLKKEKNWPLEIDYGVHIDLALSSYMQQMTLPYYWYMIPIGVSCINFIYTNTLMIPAIIFNIIVIVWGIKFISRIPNRTYCKVSDINIKLNVLRKKTLNKFYWTFSLSNSLFLMIVSLYLIEKINGFLFGLGLTISAALLLFGIYFVTKYQNIKQQVLFNINGDVYCQDKDDYWQVSVFGTVYNNPNDPRLMVSTPNGMQLTFNMAKPHFKYFVGGTVICLFVFLVHIFGYPYYLDTTHQLAELTIEENVLKVESPFYQNSWNIEDITKIELVDDLGEGRRTNGTSTFTYDTGRYTFERYGKCKVYVASLHKKYIVLYLGENVYIVNDDEVDKTINIYQALIERSE